VEPRPLLDDDGAPAARLLLGLRHALPSLVVRVVRGVDRQLLLNHPETRKLLGGPEEEEEEEEQRGYEQ